MPFELSPGLLAGIILVAIVVVVVLALIAILLLRRRRPRPLQKVVWEERKYPTAPSETSGIAPLLEVVESQPPLSPRSGPPSVMRPPTPPSKDSPPGTSGPSRDSLGVQAHPPPQVGKHVSAWLQGVRQSQSESAKTPETIDIPVIVPTSSPSPPPQPEFQLQPAPAPRLKRGETKIIGALLKSRARNMPRRSDTKVSRIERANSIDSVATDADAEDSAKRFWRESGHSKRPLPPLPSSSRPERIPTAHDPFAYPAPSPTPSSRSQEIPMNVNAQGAIDLSSLSPRPPVSPHNF